MFCRTIFSFTILSIGLTSVSGYGQDLDAARNDQIDRLTNYILDAIQPSGFVRDSLVLNGSSFHPATPDAAGFALVGLSALDHLDKLNDAEQHVEDILTAYSSPTVARSADGHFGHWLNLSNGSHFGGGWPVEYATISSALLVAGAQFASNHFPDNPTIASLTDQLTNSVDFNAAIDPSLDGGIYLTMNQSGGGSGGTLSSWNEYMLVESLALREPNNDRALAIKDEWLDVNNLPKRNNTLTDNPSSYAPAFWVQQMHFFNGDFRHSADFEFYFERQREVDQQYSQVVLDEEVRYGLTAGVSPQGYHADRIFNHPNDVFSPEAVAAWGDMETFLEFYSNQFPTSDPRYKYGLVRESAAQPAWVPNDAGLVDHLFLLFGLVESIDPNFFAERVIPRFIFGDYEHNGDVDGADFLTLQRGLGGEYDANDLTDWQANFGEVSFSAANAVTSVPEPQTLVLVCVALLTLCQPRSLTHSHWCRPSEHAC